MNADLEIQTNTFSLKHTLDCGQCFRWKEIAENEYIGVIQDRVLRLKQDNNLLYVWSNNKENLEQVVSNYLDLKTDYNKLENTIAIDQNISKSLEYSSGLHILNQPLFETIISYVISANNNIKRITRSVDSISKMFGKEVDFEGNKYYLFPSTHELSCATEKDLLSCGVGFRARYIKNDVERLKQEDKFLFNLKNKDTKDAKELLSSLMGVGPKVADCILLFSLNKSEVFPVDVWVKRIMEKLYFKENTDMKTIREYAENHFGKYSGIVQQHLFYNIREDKI